MTSAGVNPPKVIVFDLGKVLLEFDYSIAARRLAAKGTRSAEEVRQLINQTDLLHRFETGLMTEAEFFEKVCEGAGFSGDYAEFLDIFSDIFEPIPEMIETHEALRQLGVPTFIFSNTNSIAIPHIRKTYPFFSQFTGYVLSYEHGSMKPHGKLYEAVEKLTGHRGTKILYIDDRPENIEAGARRGWQVILQEDPARTRDQIRARGLKV